MIFTGWWKCVAFWGGGEIVFLAAITVKFQFLKMLRLPTGCVWKVRYSTLDEAVSTFQPWDETPIKYIVHPSEWFQPTIWMLNAITNNDHQRLQPPQPTDCMNLCYKIVYIWIWFSLPCCVTCVCRQRGLWKNLKAGAGCSSPWWSWCRPACCVWGSSSACSWCRATPVPTVEPTSGTPRTPWTTRWSCQRTNVSKIWSTTWAPRALDQVRESAASWPNRSGLCRLGRSLFDLFWAGKASK